MRCLRVTRRPGVLGVTAGVAAASILALAGAVRAANPDAPDHTAPPEVGIVGDPCHDAAAADGAPGQAQRGASTAPPIRDVANLCRYHDDNVAAIKSGRPVAGAFIGDSITQGWGRACPGLFSNGVYNRGISGQTSSQMLLRFMADVVALHPRFVHILAGTNDIAGNGGPLSAEDFENNIVAMVDIAKAHGIRVIVGAIPPADHFDWRPGIDPRRTIRDLNAWLQAYAARNDLYFVDYHSALADTRGALAAEFGDDGVHPNPRAYALMRELVRPAMDDATAQRPLAVLKHQ